MIICIQNLNPQVEQSRDNGRNIVLSSVLTEAEETATALKKDFQQERAFFFLCIPDNWISFFICQRMSVLWYF